MTKKGIPHADTIPLPDNSAATNHPCISIHKLAENDKAICRDSSDTNIGIRLEPLQKDDENQFILDNQEAFRYGAMEEFRLRNNHFEEDGEIIPRRTIEASIKNGLAYRIMHGNEKVGGLVIKVDGIHGDLELLFVSPHAHNKGIGYAAWCEVEKMHSDVTIWQTVTPYFEKRNIHFYVNRCGFHITEFFNIHHPDPNSVEEISDVDIHDEMFRFEKHIT